MLRLVVSLALIATSLSAKLPPNFLKCNRKQPDLKECILKAAQNAIPKIEQLTKELNLVSVNPFEVAAATVGAGKGTVAVEQNYKNCKIYGLTGVELNQFEFDFGQKILKLTAVVPELKKQCQYNVDGKILLFPIKGTGPSTVILKNLKIEDTLTYEEVKRKNKTYLKFVSSKINIDPELVHFNFENLLVVEGGPQQLSENINQVLNDNWKEVFDDVKSGYVEIVDQILLNVFNQFFSKLSLEEALD